MPTKPLYWNPWTRNPLDHLNTPLQGRYGLVYTISHNMRGEFVLQAAGAKAPACVTDDNTVICYMLNGLEIGLQETGK